MQALRVEAPQDEEDAVSVVGCGRALLGEEIAIVDPDSLARLPADAIGEIWVRGPHIASGYFGNEEATRESFAGTIAGEPSAAWLRTGDLGFLDAQGELFIAGRSKDLIIVRGSNHYPQDIEHTVQAADACLRKGFGAAFAVMGNDGQERVVVVQEAERSRLHAIDIGEVVGNIREAVADEHGLSLHDVVLIRPGSIAKTTSGKIQRRLTRKLWQEGLLDRLGPDKSAERNLPGDR
jgi:acyl-CoA synthetase (AMP-forming)/AMP-acid ligase II